MSEEAKEAEKKTKQRPERVTLTTLKKDYGLTDTLIQKLLPAPILKTNPIYKCAAPMKLWDKAEVERILETDEALQLIEQAEKRRQSSKKGVETKRKRLEREMDEAITRIRVERIPCKTVMRNAIRDKEDWDSYRERWDSDPRHAPMEHKIRWAVNYIRHNLTEYDEELWDMRGKVGVLEQYLRYKLAVLDAIAATYPEYKSECEAQKRRATAQYEESKAIRDEEWYWRNPVW